MAAEETGALPAADVPSGAVLRWAAHKEETRRKLLASARKLFAERGFQATSAADIAADAGVTERTLFRYFPSKSALVLDEAIALFPGMFEAVRNRPADEPPYEAVCNGIVEFLADKDLLIIRVFSAPGAVDIPVDDQQRTLLGFEDTLAAILHDRYALPEDDKLTAAVWASASIGAIRTALTVVSRLRTADGMPEGALGCALVDCFAALPGTPRNARPGWVHPC
jgi:AcrR family transcriptional regulator